VINQSFFSVVSPKNETTAQKNAPAAIWAGAALGRFPPSLAKPFMLFWLGHTSPMPLEFVEHWRQIRYWHESDSSIGWKAAILSQFVLLFPKQCHHKSAY
jgi:hypothetical protein